MATSSAHHIAMKPSGSGCGNCWGTSIGVDTLSGTGNGVAQTVTVYGRAPAPQQPIAGADNDTGHNALHHLLTVNKIHIGGAAIRYVSNAVIAFMTLVILSSA